jgi:excisionase family DNA binding protein
MIHSTLKEHPMIRTTKSKKIETPAAHWNPEPRLLTVKDVAEHLQVSKRTVHRLIDTGELHVIRIGRSVRVSGEAMNALLTRGDKS